MGFRRHGSLVCWAWSQKLASCKRRWGREAMMLCREGISLDQASCVSGCGEVDLGEQWSARTTLLEIETQA